MPTVVQFRRGTTEQNNNFTGASGELTVDSTVGTIRVHNGIIEGGSNIATAAYVNSVTGSNITTVGTLTGVNVTGNISASGNVTGSYIIGNGSLLTGLPAGYANSDVATYLASGTVSTAIMTSSTISATGNVTAGNVVATTFTGALSGAATSATTAGTVTTAAQANITSVGTLTSLNSGAISSSGTVTGTSFVGIATSARYADLAENYLADAEYKAGTVVEFGGNTEVTLSTSSHSTAVVGIVSTDPAYLMNSHLQGKHVVAVALTGRVPCRVQGPVAKGTVLVSGTIPGTAMAITADKFKPGCVVGKAMEIIDSTDVRTIEVAVGRV